MVGLCIRPQEHHDVTQISNQQYQQYSRRISGIGFPMDDQDCDLFGASPGCASNLGLRVGACLGLGVLSSILISWEKLTFMDHHLGLMSRDGGKAASSL